MIGSAASNRRGVVHKETLWITSSEASQCMSAAAAARRLHTQIDSPSAPFVASSGVSRRLGIETMSRRTLSDPRRRRVRAGTTFLDRVPGSLRLWAEFDKGRLKAADQQVPSSSVFVLDRGTTQHGLVCAPTCSNSAGGTPNQRRVSDQNWVRSWTHGSPIR